MFKIADNNYEEYKKIFEIIWHALHKGLSAGINLDSVHSPVAVLSNWEKKSMSLAKRGLREGLRESLTMISEMGSPPVLINEIKDQLAAHNLPSLNKLIAVIKETPARVLKKGRINNMDEYYIIKEVICDVDYDITQADRTQLEKLLFEFEFKKANNKKPK